MKKFKNTVKKIIPKRIIEGIQFVRKNYTDIYAVKSYSQEGEDMILRRFFENKEVGFYIDVGAHHPKRFSNTYYFYKQGWKGINIDAMPGSMTAFKKIRSRDTNIESGVNDQARHLTFYEFNEPALNGFSKELSILRDNSENYYITKSYLLKTTTLDEVLRREFVNSIPIIDFLTIDAEDLDFNVIKSISLEKYRPKLILIEIVSNNFFKVLGDDVTLYLKSNNYIIYAKTLNTVFFIDNDFDRK